MDISALRSVASSYLQNTVDAASQVTEQNESFDTLLQSAIDMLNETSDLQNQAEEAEMEFMLGYSTNTHTLNAIQEKADIALNYTIAVRDRMLDAYKEIMNMQI